MSMTKENAAGEEPYFIHQVVRGDTLWNLALLYLGKGSRYTEIKRLNHLYSDTLFVGQKLKIPNK